MPGDAKSTATPRLRFPEFRKTPGWERKQIGDVFKVTRGEVLSMTLVQDAQSGEKSFPVFSSQTKNGGLAGFYSEFLFENAITWTTDGANAGDVNYRSGKFYCTNVCGVLESNEGYANPCIAALLNTVTRNYVSYVGNPKLMNGVMAKISIPFPTPAEQQKIADCLTSLDECIAGQGRKVEALKANKQGLMQQLFPREGETLPRLRFPGFCGMEEWASESFDKLYEFKPTNNYSRDQLNYDAGTVKNIHYGDIHTKFSSQFRIEREVLPFVTALASAAEIKVDAFCQEGDMVFADASEDLADVGKSIEIVNLNGEKVISGSHTLLARRRDSAIALGFGAYLFKSRGVRAQIERVAQGTKVTQISPSRLAAIRVCHPRGIAEQQRIAACLSALDARIAAELEKLNALKTHKQGLMQQLFPSVEGD